MEGVEAWSCSGTPVDCVKLAIYKLLGLASPDLLVSGINHGANISINVLYSGTMSAAVEGAMEGIPSIGFSLMDHALEADFSPGASGRTKRGGQYVEAWHGRRQLLERERTAHQRGAAEGHPRVPPSEGQLGG
jgi:5'/3'-nucleotidase SurE